jgi:hypothetical protein
MRETRDVFHLAIPVGDLEGAREFYVTGLGVKLARRYADRITLDFFGDQLVCHLTPETIELARSSGQPLRMYPRHFGVTFYERRDFEALHALALARKIEFFSQMSVRFEGMIEQHHTFVLRDPFDNLLEFKHYDDPRMMY